MIVMIVFFSSLHLFTFISMDKKERIAEAEDALQYALQNQITILENWANERMNEIRYLTNLPMTKQLRIDEMKQIFQHFDEANSEVASIVFLDRLGHAQIDTAFGEDFEPSEVSLKDRDYFIKAEQNLEYMADIVTSRATGSPVVIFSVPVLSEQAEFQGVIFAAVRLSKVNELLQHSIYGESGQVIVLNEDGYVLSHLSHDEDTDTQMISTQIKNTRMDHAKNSFQPYVNHLGVEVFGSYASIFEERYFLINEISKQEIMKPHHRLVLFKIGIALLFICAGILFIVIFTKYLLEPFKLVLRNIKRIKAGKYEPQNQKERCSHAPIEVQQMIEAFEEMAVTINRQHNILKRESRIDELSGIYNRRFFEEYFDREWEIGRKKQQPLSLLLIDIDYFKIYNDTFGHHAGDQCLRQVAQAMQGVLRNPRDFISRYGGEEFAMVLPATNINAAKQMAETIREQVENLKIPHRSLNDYITVSIGAACLVPTHEMEKETLLKLADEALYRAKALGRNNVCISDHQFIQS